MSSSYTKKDLILDAATKVLCREGIENITIEAVAAEARISKGGLLYYFPNKDYLLSELGTTLLNDFLDMTDALAENDPLEKGKWARAYLHAMITYSEKHVEKAKALIILYSSQTKYSEFTDMKCIKLYENIASNGIDPEIATIIRYTALGLWYTTTLEMGKVDGELKEKVIDKLLAFSSREDKLVM